jgi:hypothetical protein
VIKIESDNNLNESVDVEDTSCFILLEAIYVEIIFPNSSNNTTGIIIFGVNFKFFIDLNL